MHLAIATNKSLKGCKASLDITGIGHYFDVIEAVDTGAPKPDSDVLERIAAAYRSRGIGFELQECLMVGDSPIDMQFSANAGIDSVFVCWGFYDEDALGVVPTYRISQPAELCRMQYAL
ncbi:HAD family hydrolase [Thermodesulfobacteriota bacterium]